MGILLSYDAKSISSDPTKPKTGAIGSRIKTDVYQSPTAIYNALLAYNLTTASSCTYDTDTIWGTPESKGFSNRAINVNATGLQTIFFDVDCEYMNGVYSPHYIKENIDVFKAYGVSMVQRSHSYGKTVKDDVRYSADGLIDNYPNGIKEGYHIMLNFDRWVSVDEIASLIPEKYHGDVKKIKRTAKEYILEKPSTLIPDQKSHEQKLTIFAYMYKYIIMHIGYELGLVECILPFKSIVTIPNNHSSFGIDTSCLKYGQKMYGAMKGYDLLQDTYISIDPILEKAIEWFINGIDEYNKKIEKIKKTTPSKRNAIAVERNTDTNFFDIPITDKEVMIQLLKKVKPRVIGTNTYNSYYRLLTACKYLGIPREETLHLAFDFKWGECHNIAKNVDEYTGMFINAIKELVPNLAPSINHKIGTYKETIEINDRYINENTITSILASGNTHITIQSSYDTGKTTLIKNLKEYCQNNGLTIVFASHLRSILKASSNKLDIAYYEDLSSIKEIIDIAITPHSASRISHFDTNKIMLVIDEHTQVAKTLSELYYSNVKKEVFRNLKAFYDMVLNANSIILLDADDTYGFPELHNGKYVKVKNVYKTDKMQITAFKWDGGSELEDVLFEERKKNRAYNRAGTTTHAYEKIINLLESGRKVAVPCGEKKVAEELHKLLQSQGYDGHVIHKHTEDKIKTLADIASGKNQKYSYVLYTYTAWTGFDVSVGDHPLDYVVAIFGMGNGMNHDDRAQSMKRFRGIKQAWVYGSWPVSFGIETYERFISSFEKKEEKLLSSGMFKSFEDISILMLNDNVHKNLLYRQYYEKNMKGYIDFTVFRDKVASSTTIHIESNKWKTYLHEELLLLNASTNLDVNEYYTNVSPLDKDELRVKINSDQTAEDHIAICKTNNQNILGVIAHNALVNLFNEEANKANDLLLNQHRKTKTVPATLIKINKTIDRLKRFAMTKPQYAQNLLSYRAKYIAPYEADLDNGVIAHIIKVGSLHTNIEEEIKYVNELHALITPHVNKTVICNSNDDYIDQLYERITLLKEKWRLGKVRINYGDSRDSDYKERIDKINLTVSNETHKFKDGEFRQRITRTEETRRKKLVISSAIRTLGYKMTVKRKQKNKVVRQELSITLAPDITIAIQYGSLDLIMNKIIPQLAPPYEQTFDV